MAEAYVASRHDGVLRLARPDTEWLSTGPNGGRTTADAAYNVSVPSGWEKTELTSYGADRLDRAGFDGETDGPILFTGVNVENARGARYGPVVVCATAGLSNPAALPMVSTNGETGGRPVSGHDRSSTNNDDRSGAVDVDWSSTNNDDRSGAVDVDWSSTNNDDRAGAVDVDRSSTNNDDRSGTNDDDRSGADADRPYGTVNLLVATTRSLADGALANLIAVAAEAKAATLLAEAGFPGTTTDAIVVGHDPSGPAAAFSGSTTEVGVATRACVREAVRASLRAHYADSDSVVPSSIADAAYGVSTDVRADVFRPETVGSETE